MKLAYANDIVLKFSVAKRVSSLGVEERYPVPLRRVSLESSDPLTPSLHHEVCIRLALKWINETMEPSVLVPTMIVFSRLQSIPITASTLPAQQERTAALRTARKYMDSILADIQVNKSFILDVATRHTFQGHS